MRSTLASIKFTFIVNPFSGNGNTGKKWPEIRGRVKSRVGGFETYITRKPGHAVKLARRAAISGADVLVVVGGDGTLHEVINGITNESGSLNQNLILGYLPSGTGCDLAKTLKIPQNLDEAIETLISIPYKTIDLGKLTCADHTGGMTSRYFHNVASFGLGGEVAERVNRTSKAFGGFISFVFATLISVFRYKRKHIHLRLDDRTSKEAFIWQVAVANGEYHGGGMWVARGADVQDGLFNLTLIGDFSLKEVLFNLYKLYNGTIHSLEKVETFKVRKIEASSNQRVLLEVDGEQPGRLPLRIEMYPSAIRFIYR